MAKKTQNSVETKSQSSKITLAAGFFSANQSFNSDSSNQVHYVSEKHGLEMLEDLISQNSDWYLLAYNSTAIKPSAITKAISQLPSNASHGCYYAATNYAKSKFWGDLFFGANAIQDLSNFIIADFETLTRIAHQAYVPQNEKEVVYLAEKSCSKEVILQLETLTAPKISIAELIKNKLNTTLNFYEIFLKCICNISMFCKYIV